MGLNGSCGILLNSLKRNPDAGTASVGDTAETLGQVAGKPRC